jgi:hypothetical protein
VVVIDRLVAFGIVSLAQADQDIRRVLADRNRFGVLAPAEVELDRFPHELGDGHAAALRLKPEILVRAAREPKVGRDVLLHRADDIAIPKYRQAGASSTLKYVR